MLGFDARPTAKDFKRLILNALRFFSATENTNLRSQIGAAARGANSDITSLSGLTSGQFGGGQCRLVKSGANLVLQPFNGNQIVVNGRLCTIPAAGVSLPATSLTPGTDYNIYAVATAGVVTSLEASTTGHSASSTAGNVGTEIKTGDDTRSLVGKGRPITGPAWQDTEAQRFVISWFNRRSIVGNVPWTANGTRTNAAYGEFSVAPRLEYLLWVGDAPDFRFQGLATGGSASSYVSLSFGIDSTSVAEDVTAQLANLGANSGTGPTMTFAKTGLAEGYHYTTLLGQNQGAGTTMTVYGGPTAGNRSVMSGVYQG